MSKIYARQEAIVAGLTACGFDISLKRPQDVSPGDVLVIWNRRGDDEVIADRFERLGGTVLILENGYVHSESQRYYALAQHGHNGSGTWFSGSGDRWGQMGIALKEWRDDGDYILVCPNRFIAPRWFQMPRNWIDVTVAALKANTKRDIRVRPHPGNWKKAKVSVVDTLKRDLERAHAVVIWASSAGVHSLLEGVPVVCTAPWWICKGAAEQSLWNVEEPERPDRDFEFGRLAWAQWTMDEIASGEAIRCVLQLKH